MTTKGSKLEIKVAEDLHEPVLVMSVHVPRMATHHGSYGFGTNRMNKVVFGNISMHPIKLPKKKDEQMDLGDSLSSSSKEEEENKSNNEKLTAAIKLEELPGVTLEQIKETASLPKKLMGQNQGMAPKVQGVTPENKLTVDVVVSKKSAQERTAFCEERFPENIDECKKN